MRIEVVGDTAPPRNCGPTNPLAKVLDLTFQTLLRRPWLGRLESEQHRMQCLVVDILCLRTSVETPTTWVAPGSAGLESEQHRMQCLVVDILCLPTSVETPTTWVAFRD